MNPLFAVLEVVDYVIIAVIVLVFAGGTSVLARQRVDLRRLERQLNALLQHHGVELPGRLSPEVQRLARDPRNKIAAIKLHRDQNPGLGLAEAKEQVEDFAARSS